MLAMMGAKIPLTRLISQVGAGSSWHCFAVDQFRIFNISAAVAGSKG